MAKKIKRLRRSSAQLKKRKQGAGSHNLTLGQALSLHQQGHLQQAEVLYRRILSDEPHNPEALHYLGVLAHQVGNSETAVTYISKALGVKPDYVDAQINLAIALKRQGKLTEAEAGLKKAVKLKPDEVKAHYNLGVVLKEQGKYDKAIASFREALRLKPEYAEAYNNLGVALSAEGNPEEAIHCFSKALKLNPDDAQVHYNLGIAFNRVGNQDEAVKNFRRAVALKPDYFEAYFILGILLRDLDRLDEAIDSLEQALNVKQDHPEALFNLGIILGARGKLNEAVTTFRKALSVRPTSAETHYNLGILLQMQSKHDEALASYQQVLICDPDYAEAYHNMGVVLSELGRLDEAVASFTKALSVMPYHTGTFKDLAKIKKFTEVDELVSSMLHLFDNEDTSDTDRIDLGFTLGKVFEDLGDYDNAFKHLIVANRLKRSSYDYSLQDDIDLFARIKKTFSPDFFTAHQGVGNTDSTPIFILGLPRSGTTLVEQILASHPEVFGAGELAVLITLIEAFCSRESAGQFPECILNLDKDVFDKIGATYIEEIRKYAKGEKHITDKMPDNFLRIGLIKTILPNAKVIHCTRNPMDNCFSIFKNDFKGLFKYAYDMDELGKYYKLYRDLMEYWEKNLPEFICSIKYEELVSDQESQTKNLLDFCNLSWDEACLSFHKTERRVGTSSLAQVRKPIYKDSVELWKRYENQLQPLKKAIYG
jgi:tetratricopeptide (TPR) repeat protein